MTAKIGHNQCPEEWRDDESCEDLMKVILSFKSEPYTMEAVHMVYIQCFGGSYSNSDFAALMRREIYNATGREAA